MYCWVSTLLDVPLLVSCSLSFRNHNRPESGVTVFTKIIFISVFVVFRRQSWWILSSSRLIVVFVAEHCNWNSLTVEHCISIIETRLKYKSFVFISGLFRGDAWAQFISLYLSVCTNVMIMTGWEMSWWK